MTTLTTSRATATVAVPVSSSSLIPAALAAVDAAGDADTTARATLATLVLDAYRVHARMLARTVDGAPVLPSNLKGEASARIWLDATGLDKAPAAAERTKGETSLGQYLSMYGKVATDADYGVTALDGTPADVRAIYTAINSGTTDAKKASQYRAFVVWLSGQSDAVKSAFRTVSATLATDGGKEHLAAFVADLKA